MPTLLYHWNFTGPDNLGLNEAIYDSELNLVAKVKSRGSIIDSKFSRSTDGIKLDNKDGENGGYYIDLEGLNTVELGGNISVEMVVKNKDRDIKAIYFLSVGESNEVNQAFINCRFNGLPNKKKTFFSVRPDETNESTGVSYITRVTNESSTTVVNSDDEFHYIFSLHYDDSGSSIKIYIDGDKKGENTADLEKALTNDARNTNFIGTRKEVGSGVTYLNGVIKYLKIYQNSTSDSDATSIYNNYNNSVYWSDYSSMNDSLQYTRRHTEVDTYFNNNSSTTSFNILGNQLGLSNGGINYTVHKFISGNTIEISDSYNYIPISGINNFIIIKYNSTYYKVTQTSAVSDKNAKYKCEISVGSTDNFTEEATDKGFGDTFTHNNITLVFGGLEFIESNEICFHQDTIIETDQGNIKIIDLKNYNTINHKKIIYLVKSTTIPKKLVLIKKDSLGIDIPKGDLILTKNHIVKVKNKILPVYNLIDNHNIIWVDNKNYVYNIILENSNFILVNNLKVNVFGMNSSYINYLKNLKSKGITQIEVFPSPESKIILELDKI